MDGLIIKIGWEYFIGLIITFVGSLIAIAWYSGGRFSGIEKSIEWLKDDATEMKNDFKAFKVDFYNKKSGLFEAKSPIRLTEDGTNLLEASGMKEYVDNNKEKLLDECRNKKYKSAYEAQEDIFSLFGTIEFAPESDKKIKDYAFQNGLNIDIIRRVGAIYFRDFCLEALGMNVADIDKKQASSDHS